MIALFVMLLILVTAIVAVFGSTKRFNVDGPTVQHQSRKEYYQAYLQSDAWQRKRYVVLRRDNWRCVYCGGKATQVHHTRYLKNNLGKEPIKWLVSVCGECHEAQHQKPGFNNDWQSDLNIETLYRLIKPRRRRWWRY